MKRVITSLDNDLAVELEILCIKDGKSISSMVESFIKMGVARRTSKQKNQVDKKKVTKKTKKFPKIIWDDDGELLYSGMEEWQRRIYGVDGNGIKYTGLSTYGYLDENDKSVMFRGISDIELLEDYLSLEESILNIFSTVKGVSHEDIIRVGNKYELKTP